MTLTICTLVTDLYYIRIAESNHSWCYYHILCCSLQY